MVLNRNLFISMSMLDWNLMWMKKSFGYLNTYPRPKPTSSSVCISPSGNSSACFTKPHGQAIWRPCNTLPPSIRHPPSQTTRLTGSCSWDWRRMAHERDNRTQYICIHSFQVTLVVISLAELHQLLKHIDPTTRIVHVIQVFPLLIQSHHTPTWCSSRRERSWDWRRNRPASEHRQAGHGTPFAGLWLCEE